MSIPLMFNADCLDAMPRLPAGSVDMILTDLPYGTTANKWDAVIPFAPMWAEFLRVCRPSAAIVLTASQPFTSALVMSRPDLFRHEWIWEKPNASGHLNAKIKPMCAHESILVFCDGRYRYIPQKTTGHENKRSKKYRDGTTNYGAQNFTENLQYYESSERYPRSIQVFGSDKQRGGLHPTQKPVELMRYLIRTYSNPGETVLDATMGSGTTGVAALQEGRQFIGIERDPHYFLTAQMRVLSEVM